VDLPAARTPLLAYGAYYLTTGLAPFVSREGFEAVTGRKREWWLVQTVGALVAVFGAGVTTVAARRRVTPEIVAMAAVSAASLAAIDVTYVARRRIAPSYLLDAGVQVGLVLWLRISLRGVSRASETD
jgi:hypothetical protein